MPYLYLQAKRVEKCSGGGHGGADGGGGVCVWSEILKSHIFLTAVQNDPMKECADIKFHDFKIACF